MFIIWELVEFVVRLYIRMVVVLIKAMIWLFAMLLAGSMALMVWGVRETNKTLDRRSARKALERQQRLSP